MIVTLPNGMMSVQAASTHENPKTGGLCDNNYRNYTHMGMYGNHSLSGHRLTNGVLCIPTRMIYIHQVTCSSCNAVIESYFVSECTERHSQCSIFLELHPSL